MLTPFSIAVGSDVLDDLAARVRAVRLPAAGIADEWINGTSPAYLRELIDYWRDTFDWRAQESSLNRLTHLRGTVDGATLHVVHERGLGRLRTSAISRRSAAHVQRNSSSVPLCALAFLIRSGVGTWAAAITA
jgi:hypothetical protein